ncbi:MAG TPA: competence protein CoiA family protein [Azonexus sp.]|nr:competence protein CoiA family protein [Azonexus sp.]
MHYQFFALDAADNIRSVDEVANGAACDCHCSECGGDLEAKQGPIRRWHFAHARDTGCSGGAETALHLAAKRLLLESRSLVVPEISIVRTATLPDGRRGRGVAVRPAGQLAYSAAQAEVPMANIQPDIVLETAFGPVLVEITVTNGIKREKHGKLLMLGLPALEVTLQLARSLKRDPDTHVQAWAELRQVLIESLLGKAWLVDLEKPRLNAEATAAAELDAAGATTLSEEPFPRATTAYAPAIMTDYVLSIGRDRVNVRTLPFGIAVKVTLVGDVAIDPKLVSLIKYHGGRWRQKYRNWLCPLAEQRGLYFALRQLERQVEAEEHGVRHRRVLAAYNAQHDAELDSFLEPAAVLAYELDPELPSGTEPPTEPVPDIGSAEGINERIRARIAADKAKREG